MGDEELNFTEEEARCWADDRRNQAQGLDAGTGSLIACALLLVIMLLFIAAASVDPMNSGGREGPGGEAGAGSALVR